MRKVYKPRIRRTHVSRDGLVYALFCARLAHHVLLALFPSSLAETRESPIVAFADFEKDGHIDATAIAFSADGLTLYIATDDQRVYATSANGYPSWEWPSTVQSIAYYTR